MRTIFILGLTSLLTDISSEMVYPLIPFFLTATLGAGPAVLGLIEGIAESTASILKLISGMASDRLRKKRAFAIIGYGTSAVGKGVLYLAGSWTVVFGGRLLDRIGKGIRTAPRDALIAESAVKGEIGKAFGLHRAMDTIGAALGVILAWWFLTMKPGDYASVILWSVVPAVLGVVLLFFVTEPRQSTTLRKPVTLASWHTLPPALKRFLGVALLFTLGNSSNTFLLLRAADFGYSPATIILLYLVYNLAYAGLSYPVGRWSDRIGRRWVVAAGYLLYAVVYAGFAFAGETGKDWIPWVLFIVYGLYSAATDGVEKAVIAELAPPELRASAIGLHAMIVGIGLFPASLLAGILWSASGPAVALGLGACTGVLAAVLLLAWALRGKRGTEISPA
ncbi:MAG: MFS transporter [Ignavibacteriae bacterium]|nr:MFS transporter [Ignavibacteriota bacterium]